MLKHRARVLNQAHVYPVGALTQRLRGRGADRDGRARGGRLRRRSRRPTRRSSTRRCCCARCSTRATFGHRVWLRPAGRYLARGGVAHDGEVATRLGLPAIPTIAETIALATILALMRETGVRVHLCRLSSAEGVAMVRAAKAEGLAVTARCRVHHLHLCDIDIGWFDSQAHLVPPLRGTRDRDALRAGVATGRSTPSAPTMRRSTTTRSSCRSARRSPARPGSSCCCRSPSNGRSKRTFRLADALARVTHVPARILGVEAGTLAVGAPADVCVFDPQRGLDREARVAEEPRQEHAVRRPRASGANALDAGRRRSGPRQLTEPVAGPACASPSTLPRSHRGVHQRPIDRPKRFSVQAGRRSPADARRARDPCGRSSPARSGNGCRPRCARDASPRPSRRSSGTSASVSDRPCR